MNNKVTMNGIFRYSKVVLELIVILVACVMAWMTLRERVNGNQEKITTNKENIKTNQDDIRILRERTREDIASIQSDIRVMRLEQGIIKDGIDEIKGKLDR